MEIETTRHRRCAARKDFRLIQTPEPGTHKKRRGNGVIR